MVKILITGATSFVGRHLVCGLSKHTDWHIYSFERLQSKVQWVDPDHRITEIYHDLRAEIPQQIIDQVRDADYIVHLAAEVSAQRSFLDPETTVETNVIGTYNILEAARRLNLKRFVYVSTGEVLGPVPFPFKLDERKPLRPTTPYAASKAAGEALVNAYHVSFGLPTIIVRPMNMFGELQTRGFVPSTIENLLKGHTIRCHVDEHGRCDSRNWLHVDQFNATLRWLLEDGKVGEIYHVVGPERDNLEVIEALAHALGKAPMIENVLTAGEHRYVLENTKLLPDHNLLPVDYLAMVALKVAGRV